MKKINIIGILTVSVFIFFSCSNKEKKEGYKINGIAKNISDSSIVILSANNKIIDSTIVIGEKFYFTGKIEKPTNVFLMIKNSRDYKTFWLENNAIYFIAEKGKFRESKITGSKTQKEEDLLDNRIKPLRKVQDSLSNILNDQTLSKSYQDSIINIYNESWENEAEVYKTFIKEFPNSHVSVRILNVYKAVWGKETSSKLFDLTSQEIKQSDNGKSIARFIELNRNLQIGDKYVDFEQENPNGKKIQLSNIKAKYILIEFWASWCKPCRATNPSLIKYYEQYKDQGFEIIGVSLDQNKYSWIKAIENDGLLWENVCDLKGNENEAVLIYGVSSIPDNVLIDENGIIVGRDLRGGSLKSKLEEVF